MEWVLLVHILIEAPNFTQSHTHQFVNFTSAKLCADAVKSIEDTMAKPTAGGAKVSVRAACMQRKSTKDS
jgi:hypothetical protein